MRLAIRALAATVAILSLAGCHDVDSDRIPLAAVRIPFTTIGDWHAYGIAGAATSVSFFMGRVPEEITVLTRIGIFRC